MWQSILRIILGCCCLVWTLAGCGAKPPESATSLVLAGGSGPEAIFAKKQLQEFQRLNPHIQVRYQATPSSASDRHTLYVTWLSSRSPEVDVLNQTVLSRIRAESGMAWRSE